MPACAPPQDTAWIDDLIAQHRPEYSLAQPFYNDPEIFRRDMERLIFRQWMFAGHVSRVKNPGDYFIYKIGGEEIIVVRGKDGEVYAHFNVCRHRGSRV